MLGLLPRTLQRFGRAHRPSGSLYGVYDNDTNATAKVAGIQPAVASSVVERPLQQGDVCLSTQSRGMADEFMDCNAEPSSDQQLPFLIEDLVQAAPGRASNAFARAVCLPFGPSGGLPTLQPRGHFELKVRRLVHEYKRKGHGLDPPPLDLSLLRAHLQAAGLQAQLLLPAPPLPNQPLTTRSLSAPFLVVVEPHTDLFRINEDTELLIVDASLRELLAVAPSTTSYTLSLATSVPQLFVGSRAALTELVSSMAAAIATNFANQGIDLPPWRRKAALLNRWANLEQRMQQLLLQQRLQAACDEAGACPQGSSGAFFDASGGGAAHGRMSADWDLLLPRTAACTAANTTPGCNSDTVSRPLSDRMELDPAPTAGAAAAPGPSRFAAAAWMAAPVSALPPYLQQQQQAAPAPPDAGRAAAAGGGEAGGEAQHGHSPLRGGMRREASVPSVVIVGFEVSRDSSGRGSSGRGTAASRSSSLELEPAAAAAWSYVVAA